MLIFQMYTDGYSRQEIADYLNENGYVTKSGKPFGINSFLSILRNEKYTGTFVFNHVVAKDYDHRRNSNKFKSENEVIRIENGCPAIISLEMFRKAQDIKKRGRAINGTHNAKSFYLCSGIIRCGVCGKRMSGNQRVKPGFHVYTCSSPKSVCSNIKEIDRDKLDAFAAKLVEEELNKINIKELTESQQLQLEEYLSEFANLSRTDKRFRSLVQSFLKSVIVNPKRVTFVLDIGFGNSDNGIKRLSVSRDRFLTPPQEKK